MDRQHSLLSHTHCVAYPRRSLAWANPDRLALSRAVADETYETRDTVDCRFACAYADQQRSLRCEFVELDHRRRHIEQALAEDQRRTWTRVFGRRRGQCFLRRRRLQRLCGNVAR